MVNGYSSMRCHACLAPNGPGALVCSGCQAQIPRCTDCGGALAVAARFCHSCGRPVPQSGTPVTDAEKRLVTVLFADMSRSVEAMRDLHPEDAVELVSVPLALMVDAVLEHGGRVDRFLGDGLLAVWGTPKTRENDPDQAIRAALAMRDAARKLGLDVAAGINTGEAYVGRMGSDRYQEWTVLGSSVNLASRLEGHASPGEVLVGEATYRLTRRAFEFTPRLVEVRGLARPLRAYRAEGEATRPEKARGFEGAPSALIGRAEELETLRQGFEAAAAGQGGLVGITGEAGIGKTRLLQELRSYAEGRRALWLEGRCLEGASGRGLAPFADLLSQYFEWQPQDAESVRQRRILSALQELVHHGSLVRERAAEMAPLIGAVLGVTFEGEWALRLESLDGPQLRNLTLAAIRDLLFALAEGQTLAVVLEDLHWADTLSVDLLQQLAAGAAGRPLLLLGSFRAEPDYPPAERLLRLLETGTRISPRPLTEQESERLLDGLGPAGPNSAARSAAIVRAHGNPLFLEELGRTWQDGEPVPTPEAVPETLQGLILTRVDRLAPPLRRLLQHASVVGRVFRIPYLELLGHAREDVRPALLELEDQGLIVPGRTTPIEEFSFKHVLTQQAVYETVIRQRRRRLHQQLAEGLETGDAEAGPETIAEHYFRAECYGQAIGPLLRSAQAAARLFANEEALAYYRKAGEAVRLAKPPPTAEVRLQALEGAGDILFRLGRHPEAETEFRAALECAVPLGDARTTARLYQKLADAVHWRGDCPAAIATAGEGLGVLGDDRFNPEAISLLEVRMRSCWATSDMEGARRYGDEIAALLPEVPYYDALYMVYYALAWLEIKSGNHDRAEAWLRTMKTTCRENQNENGLARAYHGLGDLMRARGDRKGAEEWFRRSLVHSERTGDAHLLMEGHIELAHALIVERGDPAEIEHHIREGMRIADDMARAGGVSSIQGLCGALGDAYTEVEELETAVTYYLKAFAFGAHPDPERTLKRLEELYTRLGRREEYEGLLPRLGVASGVK